MTEYIRFNTFNKEFSICGEERIKLMITLDTSTLASGEKLENNLKLDETNLDKSTVFIDGKDAKLNTMAESFVRQYLNGFIKADYVCDELKYFKLSYFEEQTDNGIPLYIIDNENDRLKLAVATENEAIYEADEKAVLVGFEPSKYNVWGGIKTDVQAFVIGRLQQIAESENETLTYYDKGFMEAFINDCDIEVKCKGYDENDGLDELEK